MGDMWPYALLAGLFLVGGIGGLFIGSHIGERIGRLYSKPIDGMLAGAAAGGTLGILVAYAALRIYGLMQ